MHFRYDKENEKLIVSEATRIEYNQMKIWLSRKVKNWRFHPLVKSGIWDGNISYFEDGKISLGLWKECYNACKEIGVVFNLDNKEDFPLNKEITLDSVKEFCQTFFKDHKIKNKEGLWIPFMPYDYQIESAYKILRNRYACLEIATSGGKTLVISIIFFYLLKLHSDVKFLIIVPSISLVCQFHDDLLKNYYGENNMEIINSIENHNIRIEEVMSENPRKFSGVAGANIYIGTYQSLVKWPKDWFHQFYAIATDEAHQAKATTLISILERTFKHAEYRFGVSGTFPIDDSLEILSIQSVLGPKVSQIEASSLVKKGVITPMEIKALFLNHGEKELNDKLKSAKTLDNGREIYQYEKNFIQKSEKRLNFIQKLIEKKCITNTLLLFHTIEYGKVLYEKMKELDNVICYYISGEVSGKKRNIIFDNIKTDSDKPILLIASYGCLSTGVSLPSIQNIIFADSFKSESLIIQSIGRALRLFEGKDKAIIYDLVDILDAAAMNNVFYKQFMEREKFYKKRQYPYEIKKVNI